MVELEGLKPLNGNNTKNDCPCVGGNRKEHRTRRCSRRFGLSRSVQGTARAIPPRG